MPMPPAGAAAGAAAGPRRKALTSSLVIRPFSPVPLILFRSTSSSRARRRTLGLACACPKPTAACPPPPAPGAGAAGAVAGEADGLETGLVCWVGFGSCCSTSDGGWVKAPSLVEQQDRRALA